MKKLLFLAVFALLATVVFAQELKDRVSAEVTRTEQRSQRFNEMLSNINNRVTDNANSAEFGRITNRMNDLDRQIVMLYNNLMMPVGPNRTHPPTETRSAAFTAEEASAIEDSMKTRIDEYNQLRQQLQQLNGRL
jgi:uncharacterized protein involved in exopolysaccharide biosynthesis